MALDVYSLPAVAQARATLDRYRGKIENGIGQAQTLVEVGGAAYLAARLSAHLGGPEGKNILGVPFELVVGAACGAIAMSGSAGRHVEDVLAVGVGSIAAYSARLGFQAGLTTARPPAELPAGGQVGAFPPGYCVPQMMLPAASPVRMQPQVVPMPMPAAYVPQVPGAPAYVPQAPVAPAPTPRVEVYSPATSSYEEVVGDEIDSAVEVLDRIHRR
jgi:hypothetical protein